jgi:hypothetical protein
MPPPGVTIPVSSSQRSPVRYAPNESPRPVAFRRHPVRVRAWLPALSSDDEIELDEQRAVKTIAHG